MDETTQQETNQTNNKKETNKGRKKGGETKTTFVGVAEASRICGMHPHTLRKYAREDKIKGYTTPSGQTKFDKNYLEQMCGLFKESLTEHEPKGEDKRNYIYIRVSSRKQLDDLERQVDFIRNYRPEYNSYDVIRDIASGINYKRKGLETLLDSCIQRTIGDVVIAHRDRLCRFGFELVRMFIEKSGGKVIVLDDERNKSTEQELSEDLLSIIHIYSCRQMGKRSYKNKQTLEMFENKVETITESKENIE